jgi:transposase
MKRVKHTMAVAGVDVGKRKLDAAVHGQSELTLVANDAVGIRQLITWLRERSVERVGMEATGGYERELRLALVAAGFEVVVHQPIEIKLFAKLKRWKAKNDRLDARLIAAASAQVDAVRAAQDPRLVELAERLTAYEQITHQAAQLKNLLESLRLADLVRMTRAQIRSLERMKAKLKADIILRIKAEADLLNRFKLVLSIPGFGPITAASAVIRMPELGSMQRGQAAALLGVAPFDRDSAQFTGVRFIAGGRRRPRRMLYMAALAARKHDPGFRAFADRLVARGKKKKVALVAVMRKLIEAANLVLARGQPWTKSMAS